MKTFEMLNILVALWGTFLILKSKNGYTDLFILSIMTILLICINTPGFIEKWFENKEKRRLEEFKHRIGAR